MVLEMHDRAIREMFQTRLAAYRPSGWGLMIPGLVDLGLPLFTIRRVEAMKYDPDIRLGMAIKTCPLLTVKFKMSGRPDICEFMAGEIQKTWHEAVPLMLEALWYSRCGGEIINKLGDDNRVHFGHFRDVYPSDISILTRGGNFAAIQVAAQSVLSDDNTYYGANEDPDRSREKGGKITLFPPKSFLYVHQRRFGSWNGRSELLGAFSPWLEKWDWNGALAIRRMWFYKNAYSGIWIEHPAGEYVADSVMGQPPEKIPYRDLARQMVETIRTGGVFGVPYVPKPDKPGESQWAVHQAEMNGDAVGLHEYLHELRGDILHGLEIPDDVLTSVSSSGGLAGRSVPAISFFTSQQIHLRNLVRDCKEQIWDCLAMLNFNSTDYEVQAEVDIDRLLPGVPNAAGIDGKPVDEDGGKKGDKQKQMGLDDPGHLQNVVAGLVYRQGYASVRFVDQNDRPIACKPSRWRPVETIAA